MKKLFHKIVCCVAACAVGLSLVAVPQQKAQAGLMETIAEKIASTAIEFVDEMVVKGLDYAADATGYDIFEKLGDLAAKPFGSDARKIEKMCNEILSTLTSIQDQISDLGNDLDSRISRLESYTKTYNWSSDRSGLNTLGDKYEDAYRDYTNYLSAAADYADAVADGDTAGQQKYQREMDGFLQEFADSFDVKKSGAGAINFTNDIREMARLACVNFPAYDRSNPGRTGGPTGGTPVLRSANEVCDATMAFEHQKYQMLYNQANECMQQFMTVMIVNRIWVDYQSSLSADGAVPAAVQTEQTTVANECIQAISDIATQAQGLTERLMRPYDTQATAHLNYQQSSTQDYQLVWSYLHSHEYATMPRNATSTVREYMPAYKVKPINQNGSALILQANGSDPIRHNTNFQMWSYHTGIYTMHVSSASQDYLNQMSTTDGYRLIYGAKDLYGLLNPNSYPNSGYNIARYLTDIGGLDADKLPWGMTTAATSHWREAYFSPGFVTVAYGYGHYWYVNGIDNFGLNMSDKQLEQREKEVVVKDVGMDGVGYSLPLVMLKSSGTPAYTISTNNAAVIKVEADAGGVVQDGNIYGEGKRIKAGTPMKITLHYISDISDVALMDTDGNRLETLITPDKKDWVAYNDDGTITVKTTMPYQDCRIWWATHQDEARSVQARTGGVSASGVPSSRIASFEDLKRAARAVRDNPEKYADMDFTLAAEIDAGGAEWALPIGSEAHPYTGTFDGAGHAISGLMITREAGGLFGHVGKGGTVKNLHVFDTDVSAGEGYAGTIAAVNEGTLQYCRAGAGHLLMNAAQAADIDADLLDDMNVHVDAAGTAGGLVGKNAGELLNCSTTAVVQAQTAGGLAGENAGAIRNSFGAAVAKIVGKLYSGGVAGLNNGTLENVYFGGDTEGEKDGAIAGKQEGGSADACYYDDTLDEPAGEGELAAQAVRLSDMKLDEFAKRLNERVSDGAYFWQRSDEANLGLPFIEDDPYCERTLTDEATGIDVSGEAIHAVAGLTVAPLAEADEAYKAMKQENADLAGAYDIKLNLPSGTDGEAFTGALDIAFPGGGAETETVAVLHEKDGKYQSYEAKKGEDGKYHVRVSSLSAFGIAREAVEPAAERPASSPPNSLWTVLLVAMAGIAAGAAACVIVIRRGRKKTEG